MRRVAIVAVAIALAVVAGGGASASPLTVAVRGGEQFVPNALIQSTFRFSPGPISATTGQTVTWVDADQVADEPHTITVVAQADLPPMSRRCLSARRAARRSRGTSEEGSRSRCWRRGTPVSTHLATRSFFSRAGPWTG